MSNAKMIEIKLVKSVSGRLEAHQACARGLGLRRLQHTVQVADTPENRGMINKISYLLTVKEV
jgi:large subunit ribosomal protein L30